MLLLLRCFQYWEINKLIWISVFSEVLGFFSSIENWKPSLKSVLFRGLKLCDAVVRNWFCYLLLKQLMWLIMPILVSNFQVLLFKVFPKKVKMFLNFIWTKLKTFKFSCATKLHRSHFESIWTPTQHRKTSCNSIVSTWEVYSGDRSHKFS